MGKKLLAIILGICIIALAGADAYLYMTIAQSGKVQAYTGNQEETDEKEDNQPETENQISDGITVTMSGFKLGSQGISGQAADAGSATTDTGAVDGTGSTVDTGAVDGTGSTADTESVDGAGSAADAAKTSDYILPDSDSKYYKKKDLKKLTKEEVKLARNEIYARHGRRFTKDMTVKEYFEGKDWYHATVDDVPDSELNKYEIANRDLIVAYEEKKKWR